jgi:signal transduction histidine kinase/response regulator of citrate/malate metabolism
MIAMMIRVLYAEDDPQIADTVRIYFERFGEGCSLEVVDSGRRCLDAMQRGTTDVLLLDLVMPDLDGLQILGELTARHDPTPVIMVSGLGQHELAVRALRAGAVDCIDKNSPEFLRLPDIVRRAHERNSRRQQSGPAPERTRVHRILFIDPNPAERSAVELFFGAKASRLALAAAAPEAIDTLVTRDPPFNGFVLGPHLPTAVMLDTVRQLRSRTEDAPVMVISRSTDGETAIAAFRLGAHDYLLHRDGWMTELVFSLNNALKHADTERLNARLAGELAELNRSLADQVAARTRDLEAQIAVRREAETRAEEHAARLQALSTKLLRVQEDERRAIARELHDQVGQLITGLRFQLEAARGGMHNPELNQALTITDELLRSVRELTLQLRPRMLDDLGLQPALEWHTNLFGRQTGISVELEISLPPGRLSTELETTVYRMVQEALTNIARHSGSTAAVVTVTADDQSLHVEIADHGRGFNIAAVSERRDSLGLTGLAERVRLAGGRLEIVSQPGQGTRIHAEFSLTPSTTSTPFP